MRAARPRWLACPRSDRPAAPSLLLDLPTELFAIVCVHLVGAAPLSFLGSRGVCRAFARAVELMIDPKADNTGLADAWVAEGIAPLHPHLRRRVRMRHGSLRPPLLAAQLRTLYAAYRRVDAGLDDPHRVTVDHIRYALRLGVPPPWSVAPVCAAVAADDAELVQELVAARFPCGNTSESAYVLTAKLGLPHLAPLVDPLGGASHLYFQGKRSSASHRYAVGVVQMNEPARRYTAHRAFAAAIARDQSGWVAPLLAPLLGDDLSSAACRNEKVKLSQRWMRSRVVDADAAESARVLVQGGAVHATDLLQDAATGRAHAPNVFAAMWEQCNDPERLNDRALVPLIVAGMSLNHSCVSASVLNGAARRPRATLTCAPTVACICCICARRYVVEALLPRLLHKPVLVKLVLYRCLTRRKATQTTMLTAVDLVLSASRASESKPDRVQPERVVQQYGGRGHRERHASRLRTRPRDRSHRQAVRGPRPRRLLLRFHPPDRRVLLAAPTPLCSARRPARRAAAASRLVDRRPLLRDRVALDVHHRCDRTTRLRRPAPRSRCGFTEDVPPRVLHREP